jgi:phosphoribosylanthranilate isomerase
LKRSTLIKICGIARLEDGRAALRAGADWLGFIRWPASPRYRSVEEHAAIAAALRAEAGRAFQVVGVYVDAPPESIESEIAAIGLDRVQLHGEETLEAARGLSRPAIKVIKIRDAESIARADDYPEMDLLADTADPILPGGTGRAYDPRFLIELTRRRRVFVAGGLNPENVGRVVALLRPWGVDVSSGVESSPGVKDAAKVEAFVAAVREADASAH